jgi:hypothetical protein
MTTTDTLNKTTLPEGTAPKGATTLQSDTHNLVANQLGQDGLGRPVGDLVSREGVNRVERKGKDERGGYVPDVPGVETAGGVGVGQAVAGAGNAVVGGVVAGSEQAKGAVKGGVERAAKGGWFGFGRGKGQE